MTVPLAPFETATLTFRVPKTGSMHVDPATNNYLPEYEEETYTAALQDSGTPGFTVQPGVDVTEIQLSGCLIQPPIWSDRLRGSAAQGMLAQGTWQGQTGQFYIRPNFALLPGYEAILRQRISCVFKFVGVGADAN
jgi:hypothetical protein